MPSTSRTVFKYFSVLFLLFFFYIFGCLIYATSTDFAPEEGKMDIDIIKNDAATIVEDSTLTFLSWNVGYGGLGKESDFFYNGSGFFFSGDHMVRSPRNLVEKNMAGSSHTLKENKADFYFLQEVDFASKRSYYISQRELFLNNLPDYSHTSAINFDVNYVPTPLFQPWKAYGEANSGLMTFSRFAPQSAERHQLPGKFSWPNRLFLLDRCLALQRYPVAGGKTLTAINLHNSAYDRSGTIKSQQMEYLRKLILTEYEQGNYVVVGGDWNQCPPGFPFDTFRPGVKKFSQSPNIADDYMPAGWQWAYDPQVPTIRSSAEIYETGKTFISIIDFFLLSPNLEVIQVKGIDQDFDFSDHQGVRLEVKLN